MILQKDYPHQDSNLELRFRKPPVCPFTYGGEVNDCSHRSHGSPARRALCRRWDEMPATQDTDRMRANAAAVAQAGLGAMVCALPTNVLLLSGYWPIVGTSLAVVTADGRIGVMAPEDESGLAQSGWAVHVMTFEPGSLQKVYPIEGAVVPKLRELVDAIGIRGGKIGFEQQAWHEPASYVAMNLYGAQMAEIIREAVPGATPVSGDSVLRKLRSVLTRDEVAKVRKACDLAAQAFFDAPRHLTAGVKETIAAANIERPLFSAARAGGHVAVMSGVRSSKAFGSFARSTESAIQKGDLALVHCNSTLGGFWTDITRTFLLSELDQRRREMYETVFEARHTALEAIRPGARAADIDRAARNVMQSRGLGDNFKHPTGHGVGFAAIDHNAQPIIHPKSQNILEPGMVFNIEPAIYIDGKDGMRHCDMVVVTDSGAQVLTPFLHEIEELLLPVQ
jgi:Xaa-Pro aminopeptidase